MNTELDAHFDRGPIAVVANTTLGVSHFNQIIQVSGSGVTLTFSDAATLGAEWYCDIISTDTSNNVTLARATAADTWNSTTADDTLYPLEAIRVFVNAAANGFRRTGSPATITRVQSFTKGIGPDYLQNISVTAAIATKALTIALKGKDGNDPSSTNIVEAAFRSTTITSGTYNVRQITSATSIVVPSGATLGFTAAESGTVYVYLCDDGTTRELGVSKSVKSDATLHSTTAISTSADSANVIYTTTALTNAAIRLIGKFTIQTGAVAGEWDNAHTASSLISGSSVSVEGSAFSTGDVKATFKSTADAGWVMMNDGSIGSAASSATTRAHSDTEDLYTLLWTNVSDTWAAVSTGRGASAAADFAANKTLTLPRALGRALAVAGAGASLTSRALGEYLGTETHTLVEGEIPSHSHSVATTTGSAGAAVGYRNDGGAAGANMTTGNTGGGGAHNNMQPTSFLNVMIKL